MNATAADGRAGVRYQPDERPPTPLALGVGLQLAVLNVAAIVLIPLVVMRAAGMNEEYLSWAVLASVTACGLVTMLQAVRAGRFGAGHVLLMGTSGAFIPASIMALTEGGPALLATLVVVAAFIPLLLAWRLSLFQRVLTPSVSGTVIMLIPVTVLPFVSGLLATGPDGGALPGAPLSFFATLILIGCLALRGKGALRLWAPVIGVVAGTAIAASYGLYDVERIADAAWIALPRPRPPGFDLEFGPAFWTLLPSFLLVAVIASIRTMSSAVAIQRVSWRRASRATDFRAVQGAVAVDGVGNLLAGLAGTVPGSATTTSVPLTQLTGVAARGVGLAAGTAFIAFAFLPKAFAVVLAIPDPVFAGYLGVLLAMLFAIGLKIVLRGGLDYRDGIVVGLAFLTGVSCQYGLILPEQVSAFAGGLMANGMNAGGFTAIGLTLFLRLTEPRRARIETEFGLSALPKIREFLGTFAAKAGLDAEVADRLAAAAEEALLSLTRPEGSGDDLSRRLAMAAHRDKGEVALEFLVAPRDENLQDRLALLSGEVEETSPECEVSLRLLRHLASSVRHQQYHGTDIVTVRVAVSGAPGGGS
ncbi:uracil-xanthine permease family protein [Candidatus Palauibacter sp.]|uniref:uracil-xanthine permease family protein n=1 Tax=Candidatus Palauibacter sp. TaxID=3101350 RepID=UPI003B516602